MMPFKAELSEEIVGHDNPKNYIQDDDWWAEQKIDGQRILLRLSGQGEVSVFNRQGDQMGLKNPALVETFSAGFNGEWWFDGEYMDDHYYVFDILCISGIDWWNKPYQERRAMLEKLFLLIDSNAVSLVPVARTELEKAALYRYTREHNFEGLVFKPIHDQYKWGEKGRWKKYKHYNTADCVIMEMHRGGKEEAVTIGCYNEVGELVEVSGLKMMQYYMKMVKPGDVVEVRYLHATPENKLYIPTFVRVRLDKPASECYTSQLIQTNKQVIKDYK